RIRTQRCQFTRDTFSKTIVDMWAQSFRKVHTRNFTPLDWAGQAPGPFSRFCGWQRIYTD
ncbi:MAG TPA: hypothetical protein VF023_03535, partial [Bryobacteraceae bacterium]